MNIEIPANAYINIPKGTVFMIPNPNWNEDDPKTKFYCYVQLPIRVCAELRTGKNIQATLVQKTKSTKLKSAEQFFHIGL